MPGALPKSKNKPANGKRLTLPHRAFRTAMGSGMRILDGVDGRCAVARRYAEVAGAIAQDLGGEDELTELQKQLIRSVSGLIVLRERLDAKALNDERFDVAEYCRLSNSLRRIAATLGLRRLPKDITPTLDQYLSAKRAAAEADYDEVEP